MALKRLYSGKARGTNASLSNASPNNAERVTLYTVPSGKVAVIKHIFYKPIGNSASIQVTLYVLKSGGTDASGTYVAGASNATHDAIIIANGFATNAAIGTISTTIVLEASDALKMELYNSGGAAVDVTVQGVNIHVSGDES